MGTASWAPQYDIARLVTSELEAARWARWAAWAQALWSVVSAIVFALTLRAFLDFFDEIASQPPGYVRDEPTPVFSTGFLLSQMLSLVQLGAFIAWIVWQYRANTAAQALGLRLTRSPGWGIAGWFIPIVNLWFPYESARDNLPAQHPARPVVLRWWLGWLLISFIVWFVALIWVLAGPLIGLTASVLHLSFAVWWVTRADRMLVEVGDEHRRLAGISS